MLVAVAALSLVACLDDRSDIEKIKRIPAKRLRNYESNLDRPVPERIAAAPPVVIDYLRKMDRTDAYVPYAPTEEERILFSSYYERLPGAFKKTMSEKVIGVFFVDGFKGGGMSDYVFDENGNMYISFILNRATLVTGLSEWIALRDSSTFELENSGVLMVSICGDGGYRGLVHTLVHEACHIYDYFAHVTPYTERHLKESSKQGRKTAFTGGYWSDYGRPVKSYDFENRNKLTVYGLGPKLKAAEAVAMYSSLKKDCFSSLYGSQNWAEDFAETFAWYFLNKEYGITYKVTIHRDGRDDIEFSPQDSPLVKSRYALFESIR